jgi:CRISPR/Cas system CSM-associated protein Csm3 (group 7 of RAMP superfamily)
MSRDFININYHIEFETPFHFGTGLRRNLLDRSVCRDADDYLYIPGSTLKGVFRERCEQIARLVGLRAVSPHDEQEAIVGFRDDIDIVDRIFGSRYKQSELYFDNVTMVEADQKLFDSDRTSKRYIHRQTEVRTQTSISRLLGTVREQALFQSEFGTRTLCFEGRIYGYLEGFRVDQNEWSYSVLLLVAGILANDRLGANKSTGMGKYSCQIQEEKVSVNDIDIEVATMLATLNELRSYPDIREESV